jgi:hypothetical protein
MIVLAKAKGNLLVRIRIKRAATDINLQPMSQYFPNSIFVFIVFHLYDFHNLQADVSSTDFLRQLLFRLPDEL